MKKIIAQFLIYIYKKLTGREPCIVYRRLSKYTDNKNGFKTDCPFCNTNKYIKQTKYFYIINNKYPYPNTKEHLLIVPKRHIIGIGALNNSELLDIQVLLAKYMGEGYLLLGRQFGAHKESSVEHLHLHLIK